MIFISACAGLLLILSVYRYLIHPTFISPLSKIPAGHWTAHFSPAWILWKRWTNTENEAVQKLHLAHGPCIRLGPKELSLNGFEGGLKQIYLGGFPKTNFYPQGFVNYG
jgi:hypothetical protein